MLIEVGCFVALLCITLELESQFVHVITSSRVLLKNYFLYECSWATVDHTL